MFSSSTPDLGTEFKAARDALKAPILALDSLRPMIDLFREMGFKPNQKVPNTATLKTPQGQYTLVYGVTTQPRQPASAFIHLHGSPENFPGVRVIGHPTQTRFDVSTIDAASNAIMPASTNTMDEARKSVITHLRQFPDLKALMPQHVRTRFEDLPAKKTTFSASGIPHQVLPRHRAQGVLGRVHAKPAATATAAVADHIDNQP